MTIKNAELFISIVTVLLTYFVCAPLVGYVRAKAAVEMGDTTPEQLGFLTINPFMHVSKIWLVLIVWFQVLFQYMPFGLGQYIPINPANIQGRYRGLRLATAYFADTIAAIVIAIFAFFSMLAIHGTRIMKFNQPVVTLQNLSAMSPQTGSLGIVVTWILMSFFIMSTLMAAFGLIINCFHFVYFYYFEDSLRDNEYADMIMLFGPLLLLYILIPFFRGSIMKFVIGMAYLLAYSVGLVN